MNEDIHYENEELNIKKNEEVNISSNKKKTKFLKGFFVGILSAFSFIVISLVALFFIFNSNTKESFLSNAFIVKTNLIKKLIDEKYFGEINDSKLNDGMYHGLVLGLNDQYSCYYNKEETKAIMEETTGNYSGIGAYIMQDENRNFVISDTIENSPARKANLKTNDIIEKIDDKKLTNLSLQEITELIKGEIGSKVKVSINRDNKRFDITLTREEINVPSISGKILSDNNIGYIRIDGFKSSTHDDFKKEYDLLRSKKISSLIIDLRNNPGGEVNSVVEILDELLGEGLLFYSLDNKNRKEEYKSKGNDTIDIPVAVLVNEMSASASEIFSGAIRDRINGIIIGKTTYGKGVINQILSLGDGSTLRLTIAKYYTPNGIDINEKGIKPDIEIDNSSDNNDMQLQRAVEELKNR